MKNWIKSLIVLVVAMAGVFVGIASAETFAVFANTTSGSLNGVNFTIATSGGPTIIAAEDLSTADYVPPGSATQGDFEWVAPDTVTITFASPVSNVDLYLIFLRGASAGGPASYTITPTGSGAWNIQSGLAGAGIVGNTLSVPPTFSSGILHFTGAITSLVIAPVACSGCNSFQGLTLGLIPSTAAATSAPIPTLSQWGMIILSGLLALGAVFALRRQRR